MKFYDNNTIALICLTVIVALGIIYKVDGIKEITLAISGAVAGWMARGSSVGMKQ
jgi:hypothetical protein